LAFFAALRFLTIIPSPFRRRVEAEELGRSLGYFPLVGLGLGLLLIGLDWLLGLVFPLALVNAILIVALVAVTGALHVDGLMDVCDGLAAGRTREQRLEIMRDSRVGSFGAVGAFSLLLLKYFALASVPGGLRVAALLLMPVLGRWAMVYTVRAFPYARPEGGMGGAFKRGASFWQLTLATLVALAVSLGVLYLWGLVVMGVMAIVVLGVGAFFKSRLGGLTGDTYGAINEIAEVVVLLTIAGVWGYGR
jgi:adenosylcobinamide-GDP ribazoletransferase